LGVGVATALACSDTTSTGVRCTGASGQAYKPGQEILCRCADRTDGTRICQDDGTLSRCEPCFAELLDDGGIEEYDVGPPSDAPLGCGDGRVDPEELCDDGNLKDGDLCDSQCRPVGNPPAARTCPGQEVHVWSTAVNLSGDTSVYAPTNSMSPACDADSGNSASGSLAGDRIYGVVAHGNGNMVITISNATFNQLLYVREKCEDRGAITCANRFGSNSGETLTFPVKEGEKRFVVVDGDGVSATGKFNIKFELQRQ
jgi:cysteine-rich repeat protein